MSTCIFSTLVLMSFHGIRWENLSKYHGIQLCIHLIFLTKNSVVLVRLKQVKLSNVLKTIYLKNWTFCPKLKRILIYINVHKTVCGLYNFYTAC